VADAPPAGGNVDSNCLIFCVLAVYRPWHLPCTSSPLGAGFKAGETCLGEENMKKAIVAALSIALINLTVPAVAGAAEACPAELADAQAALKSAQAALKKSTQVAKGQQDIQAPRSQAGAKSQDIQAPRSQDIQAPRSQDIQAPRSQDIQAPRGQQEIPVPRAQDIQAPRVNKAAALVRQAEAACKKGDMAQSSAKAKEALGLLK